MHSQRRAHARPIFPPSRALFKGVPLVAASKPWRRSNAPHRRYRGHPYIVCAHTSCERLGIMHSQRRAHARPIFPPSRAPFKGVPLEPCCGTFTGAEAFQRAPPSIRGHPYIMCAHTSCERLGIMHSQRSAHARPIFPPSRAPFKGVPLVAVSQARRRSNAPHHRYRGYLYTVRAHPSCWTLETRHSQRRAHA